MTDNFFETEFQKIEQYLSERIVNKETKITVDWLTQLQKLEKDLFALIGELLALHNYTLAKVENPDLQRIVRERIEFLRQCRVSLADEVLSSWRSAPYIQPFPLTNLLKSLALLVLHLEAQPDLNKFELPPGNPIQGLVREALGAVNLMCRWLESEEMHMQKHLKHQSAGKKGADVNQPGKKKEKNNSMPWQKEKRKIASHASQAELIDIIFDSGESPYKRKATIAAKLRELKNKQSIDRSAV